MLRTVFRLLVVLILMPHPVWAQQQTNAFTATTGAAENALILQARLSANGPIVQQGLVWSVFGETPGTDGKLPLITSSKGGVVNLNLPSGSYLVHAAIGRASASKRVFVSSAGGTEEFILEAGGLEMHATSGGRDIPPRRLRFSVYELEQDENGERELIALNVAAGKVIALNAGTYHVLSRYGTINATVRADLVVEPGKLTRATLEHRGAPVSMRLVSRRGGPPLANTSWTVFTEDGERVFSSSSVSPSLVLAEGRYEAVVKFGDEDLRQIFNIIPGRIHRVEILLEEG
ncbi:MAG: hypothetical protein AAF903_09945 [Pseudomonadota bacterium]